MVGCAAAVFATAGGAVPAIMAVLSVYSGTVAASAGATMAASALIASAEVFGGMMLVAAMFSSTVEDFNEQGNWGTVAFTAGGALLGGAQSYLMNQILRPKREKTDSSISEIKPRPVSYNKSALSKDIAGWLGEDTRIITNKAGDKVFLSSDELRRVRFDINNPYPHAEAHAHIEISKNGKWVGANGSTQIYPKG